jgi:hypothetical protein
VPLSRLFLIAFMALFSGDSALASDTNDIVWQLNLKDGHPTNCQLAFTRVTQDDKGSAGLEEDTRPDKGAWHSCIALPKGLLKAGKDFAPSLAVGFGWKEMNGQPRRALRRLILRITLRQPQKLYARPIN